MNRDSNKFFSKKSRVFLKKLSIVIILLNCLPALSGCGLCGLFCSNKNEILENSYEEGFKDGERGFTQCDRGCDYKAGWEEGVRCFCTPENGYAIGAAGKRIPCICPPDLAGEFRTAWYHGSKCYYTPELGCGLGCSKTYDAPDLPCRTLADPFYCVPEGCGVTPIFGQCHLKGY